MLDADWFNKGGELSAVQPTTTHPHPYTRTHSPPLTYSRTHPHPYLHPARPPSRLPPPLPHEPEPEPEPEPLEPKPEPLEPKPEPEPAPGTFKATFPIAGSVPDNTNAVWLKNQDGTILSYKVLLPLAASHSPTPPTATAAVTVTTTGAGWSSCHHHLQRHHAIPAWLGRPPRVPSLSDEEALHDGEHCACCPPHHHPTRPNHPTTPLLPPPPHCRAPNISARSMARVATAAGHHLVSALPMSAPTTRPTLTSPTPSPATTTLAATGRASRPRAATASRHRTASCTAPCTAHAPHSRTLCTCCAHCAPRPRLRGVRLADPPHHVHVRAVRDVRKER